MSRLKDISEQSEEEYFLKKVEKTPLSSYIPKNKDKGEKLKSDLSLPKISEDRIRANGIAWMRSQGWKVRTIYMGGIPVGGGRLAINPAKGIPDCIVFLKNHSKKIWIEWKKSHGGIISPEQQEWHRDLRACGEYVYVISSLEQLKEDLKEWV